MNFIKKHSRILSIVIMMILILGYMKIWLSSDEYFTIEMLKRSYTGIVYVDSFDVHPPLYYIVLKFVLSVVLPFNHSVLYDIIASRIFSVMCSLLTVHFLIKINSYFGIKFNNCLQYLIFFMIPNVLSVDNMNFSPSVNIRMYSLATLFVVLTLYFILKYNNSNKIKYICLVTLFAELAAYTHYYAALISGLFLLIYFIYYFIKKKFKKCMAYLFSGIAFFVLYIPWIVYGLSRQLKSLAFSAPLYKSVIQFVIAAFIIAFFIVPFVYLFKNTKENKKVDLKIILLVNLIVILFTTLYSVVRSPIFLIRYVYPSMVIMEFIVICYIYQSVTKDSFNKSKLFKSIAVISIVCIPLFCFASFVHEIIFVEPISINIFKNDMIFHEKKEKFINLDEVEYPVKEFDFNHSKLNNDTEFGLYIRSIGKVPYVTSKNRYDYDLVNKAYPSVHFVPKQVAYIKK